MTRQVICRAPGKLLIAGEYAVLTPDQPAIVAALDRYVTATATPAWQADIELITGLSDTPFLLYRDQDGRLPIPASTPCPPALTHLLPTLAAADELRAHFGAPPLPVRLNIRSELHDQGVKIGLGSSGAVTVATIDALTTFYRLNLAPELRLRLALLATAQADPHASGADVAASTWGGWIRYTATDRDRLRRTSAAHGVAATLRGDWPGLSLHPLPPPTSSLHVGWTGHPASTPAKVSRLQDTTWWNSAAHHQFCDRSARIVTALTDALHHGEDTALLSGIDAARRLLSHLDWQTCAGVFTPALVALCDAAKALGGAGKPSGAGGGDCGIALLPAHTNPDTLHRHWDLAGITPLVLATAPPTNVHASPSRRAGPVLASGLSASALPSTRTAS
ncbi:phosphomevalonate kinase [Streptomyces sp. NPDC054874]